MLKSIVQQMHSLVGARVRVPYISILRCGFPCPPVAAAFGQKPHVKPLRSDKNSDPSSRHLQGLIPKPASLAGGLDLLDDS